MDISLVMIDMKEGKLDYAGANNPLYLVRDSKLMKYPPDRMPIGIHFISFTPFTNRTIEIMKGDSLYLFSDGYADQFGGPKGRKFMYKPFQNLLLQNHNKPMEQQKDILDTTFEDWKGNRDQRQCLRHHHRPTDTLQHARGDQCGRRGYAGGL